MAQHRNLILALAAITFTSTAIADDTASADAAQAPADAVETAANTTETVSERQSSAIAKTAGVYATYQTDVTSAKSKPLSSTKDIDRTLTDLGSHNPDQLTQSWLAYSALVAAQDPEYRAAVRDIEGFYGRDRLLTGMRNDLRYARSLGGADNAVSAALTAIEADSDRLQDVAAYMKEQAYTLQGAGWAKARVASSGAKADQLNAAAAVGQAPDAPLVAALISADMESAFRTAGVAGAPSMWENVSTVGGSIRVPGFVADAITADQSPQVRYGKERTADRIATLAAFHAIGVGNDDMAQLQTALSDRDTRGCLNMANLNLQQCVAAAHQHHELPFCISQHALSEIGDCIGDVAQ
ncbi:MAG: hypothetical protein AAFQ67_03500 [Pseudomonadota bacterium]